MRKTLLRVVCCPTGSWLLQCPSVSAAGLFLLLLSPLTQITMTVLTAQHSISDMCVGISDMPTWRQHPMVPLVCVPPVQNKRACRCACAGATSALCQLHYCCLSLLSQPPPGNALEALPEGLFSLPKLHTLNVSRNKVGLVGWCFILPGHAFHFRHELFTHLHNR
jgi:hypothetical protein